MMQERRKFYRAPLSIVVKYKDAEDKDVEAFTGTIGGGGVFIETFKPLTTGKELSIELTLPGSEKKTVIECTVVWSREKYDNESPPGMGIKFNRITKKDSARLNELITRILVGGSEEGI